MPGLPPLSSGLVGFFAYDMVRRLERLPELAVDDLGLPDMLLLLATDIAAVDHHEGTITLIANAVNWNGTDERVDWAYDDAVARLDVMTAALGKPLPSTVATFSRPTPMHRSQRTVEEYTAIVDKLVGDIEAGEAFQVVPSQRFEMDTDADPIDVYRMLRVTNPSPYMYLLNVPNAAGELDFSIVGSSPEALVTVQDGKATTHPIAGTRWRGATEEEDVLLEKELLSDEKERAEHLMLVDLGRNDLGRVCVPGTVRVEDYSHIERYSHVMHLVSTVTGQLADGRTALDAVTACFPAGTLSGAPKVRAMELIEEVEKTRRGLYGGVLGYLDFAGNADFAIAIRTALMRGGTAYVQAGGGVVADSNGPYEYNEAANKARAVLNAIAAAETLTGAVMRHDARRAACCWCSPRWRCGSASRMTWVEVTSFDGLGPAQGRPTLIGATWSTALIPLALLVLAAAVAALAVRGWPLRCWRAGRGGQRGHGLPGDRLVGDPRRRGARPPSSHRCPVAALIGTQRHALGRRADRGRRGVRAGRRGAAGAVGRDGEVAATEKYAAPAARRAAGAGGRQRSDGMSERMIWDALDEGRDPTGPGQPGSVTATCGAGDYPSIQTIRDRPGRSGTARKGTDGS